MTGTCRLCGSTQITAKGLCMKQLGNAVCPAMAQGIAEQMEAA